MFSGVYQNLEVTLNPLFLGVDNSTSLIIPSSCFPKTYISKLGGDFSILTLGEEKRRSFSTLPISCIFDVSIILICDSPDSSDPLFYSLIWVDNSLF